MSILTATAQSTLLLMKPQLMLGSRAFWLRQMRQWHWISAAICLIGMLLFSVTGITLNHAGQIEARPSVSERTATVPKALLDQIKSVPAKGRETVPAAVATWVSEAMRVDVRGREAELSPNEIYIALPRPGGDAWLALDRQTGEARYERTDRGWISYLNDLHKGRNTGAVWSLFLDLFAIACIIFCLTVLCCCNCCRMRGPRHGRWSAWVSSFRR